jgi:hypothetical protein
MWATLALAAALQTVPAQPGDLALKNPRLTHGMFGQQRKDARLLPGDLFMLAYEITGLTIGPDGRVLYSIGMELTNKEGKSIFKQEPKELEAVNTLGGNSRPAFAFLEIGPDTAKGEYTVKIQVTDRAAKKTADLTYRFEILPTSFGFVQASIVLPNNLPTPPTAVPGQEFWVNFALVGFDLDAAKKQPNVTVEMQVIDLATGKPTLAKPFTGESKNVAEEFKKILPMQFILQLNRPGKYQVQLKATDNNGKKTAEQTLDFTVLEGR